MDKSLKSRQIGYVKPKTNDPGFAVPEKPKTENAPQPKKEEEPPKSEKKSDNLVSWLTSHDFINKAALCKAAKVDRANFDKYLKIGEFPERFATPLIEQLKKYGYAE